MTRFFVVVVAIILGASGSGWAEQADETISYADICVEEFGNGFIWNDDLGMCSCWDEEQEVITACGDGWDDPDDGDGGGDGGDDPPPPPPPPPGDGDGTGGDDEEEPGCKFRFYDDIQNPKDCADCNGRWGRVDSARCGGALSAIGGGGAGFAAGLVVATGGTALIVGGLVAIVGGVVLGTVDMPCNYKCWAKVPTQNAPLTPALPSSLQLFSWGSPSPKAPLPAAPKPFSFSWSLKR